MHVSSTVTIWFCCCSLFYSYRSFGYWFFFFASSNVSIKTQNKKERKRDMEQQHGLALLNHHEICFLRKTTTYVWMGSKRSVCIYYYLLNIAPVGTSLQIVQSSPFGRSFFSSLKRISICRSFWFVFISNFLAKTFDLLRLLSIEMHFHCCHSFLFFIRLSISIAVSLSRSTFNLSRWFYTLSNRKDFNSIWRWTIS